MVAESILFMFGICMGTFQLVGSWSNMKGFSFFKNRYLGYVFGIAVVIGSFYWFFATVEFGECGPKGQHDDQFKSFTLGIFGALFLTWLLSSIINYRPSQRIEGDDDPSGIEVFREETFFQVVRRRYLNNRYDRDI